MAAIFCMTALALGTTRATALRHRVKCVDRLLANVHLRAERQAIYAALARRWLSGLPQLLIVVLHNAGGMLLGWIAGELIADDRGLEALLGKDIPNLLGAAVGAALERRSQGRPHQTIPSTRPSDPTPGAETASPACCQA